jgi:hypothetical protein
MRYNIKGYTTYKVDEQFYVLCIQCLRLDIVWSGIVKITPSCWFYSEQLKETLSCEY